MTTKKCYECGRETTQYSNVMLPDGSSSQLCWDGPESCYEKDRRAFEEWNRTASTQEKQAYLKRLLGAAGI